MAESSKPTGPPPNPGLRELVAAKRRWSSPSNAEAVRRGFRGWHERGFLPHRDEPGLTQFVTFHLAGSFPVALRAEWKALLEIEDDFERRRRLEQYLDQGRGECHLRQPALARLVEDALRHHHPSWYELRAWVIMPNHLHCLVKIGETPLAKIVKELKRYTGRAANQRRRCHTAFWAEDYFDTYMRDAAHELQTRVYIENNPVKALLVREPKSWPWSSTRFRDEHGTLQW